MFVTGFLQRATLDKSLCFARGLRAGFFTYLFYFAYIAMYIYMYMYICIFPLYII